ncbi:hypothetical protein DLAC_02120 [Tieghemostelium lacteum]|uniref:Uncharacterized protein n=1 Tax=Tieghemostelium lacteum TaxID=361077 RepID=A0A152A489_TIELA|nr:hypothetical protein DLAC_02120 [Tieghemostelium lacteum]|eukprot:KYR01034.1 hypothetical protein DLAC_02120 [Tieghemostelium lacteum]
MTIKKFMQDYASSSSSVNSDSIIINNNNNNENVNIISNIDSKYIFKFSNIVQKNIVRLIWKNKDILDYPMSFKLSLGLVCKEWHHYIQSTSFNALNLDFRLRLESMDDYLSHIENRWCLMKNIDSLKEDNQYTANEEIKVTSMIYWLYHYELESISNQEIRDSKQRYKFKQVSQRSPTGTYTYSLSNPYEKYSYGINKKNYQKVLNIFRNLTTLRMSIGSDFFENYELILENVARYCPNLVVLNVYFQPIHLSDNIERILSTKTFPFLRDIKIIWNGYHKGPIGTDENHRDVEKDRLKALVVQLASDTKLERVQFVDKIVHNSLTPVQLAYHEMYLTDCIPSTNTITSLHFDFIFSTFFNISFFTCIENVPNLKKLVIKSNLDDKEPLPQFFQYFYEYYLNRDQLEILQLPSVSAPENVMKLIATKKSLTSLTVETEYMVSFNPSLLFLNLTISKNIQKNQNKFFHFNTTSNLLVLENSLFVNKSRNFFIDFISGNQSVHTMSFHLTNLSDLADLNWLAVFENNKYIRRLNLTLNHVPMGNDTIIESLKVILYKLSSSPSIEYVNVNLLSYKSMTTITSLKSPKELSTFSRAFTFDGKHQIFKKLKINSNF